MRKMVSTIVLAALVAVFSLPVAAADGGFDALAGRYEPIRKALLHDSTQGVAGEAAALAKAARSLEGDFSAARAGVAAGDAEEAKALVGKIAASAGKLAKAGDDLDAARDLFAELSAPMIAYAHLAGSELAVGTCPMVGESWLQPEGEVGNPYMGQKMAGCGNLETR